MQNFGIDDFYWIVAVGAFLILIYYLAAIRDSLNRIDFNTARLNSDELEEVVTMINNIKDEVESIQYSVRNIEATLTPDVIPRDLTR